MKGLREEIQQQKLASELLADLSWLYDEVSHPWWVRHLRSQIETQGVHGGDPWNFANEPRYRAFKERAVGHDDVFRWEPGREQIVPSLTEIDHPMHDWTAKPLGYSLSTSAPHADVFEGGIGPFGEPYPARDPFRTREDQLAELDALEQQAINDKLREIGLTVVDR